MMKHQNKTDEYMSYNMYKYAELNNRSLNVVDKHRLLELDEQRRRAEQDKMAAIRALEKRFMEFIECVF